MIHKSVSSLPSLMTSGLLLDLSANPTPWLSGLLPNWLPGWPRLSFLAMTPPGPYFTFWAPPQKPIVFVILLFIKSPTSSPDASRMRFLILSIPLETCRFLNASLHRISHFCLWRLQGQLFHFGHPLIQKPTIFLIILFIIMVPQGPDFSFWAHAQKLTMFFLLALTPPGLDFSFWASVLLLFFVCSLCCLSTTATFHENQLFS